MGKLLYGTAYDGKVRFSAIDSKDLVMEQERDISSVIFPLWYWADLSPELH